MVSPQIRPRALWLRAPPCGAYHIGPSLVFEKGLVVVTTMVGQQNVQNGIDVAQLRKFVRRQERSPGGQSEHHIPARGGNRTVTLQAPLAA